MTAANAEAGRALAYLGLPLDYSPSPSADPVKFLSLHVHQLPPEILSGFSTLTTARERSIIPVIRNRRFRYTQSDPDELKLVIAKRTWPALWDGPADPPTLLGKDRAREEREWVEHSFIGGSSKFSGEKRHHVGKLGSLLGDYEEERELERMRGVRREIAANNTTEFVPEEDEESEEEEEESMESMEEVAPESAQTQIEYAEEMEGLFDRRIRERFIYGILQSDLYDAVDWAEQWDGNDQDVQDRWFEEDE